MVLILAVLLVVASVALFALGVVGSTLGLIYTSMACAGVAGVVVVLVSRRASLQRQRSDAGASTRGPEEADPPPEVAAPEKDAPEAAAPDKPLAPGSPEG